MQKGRQEQTAAMRSLVERWQSSGLSKSAFCRQEGISQATFYYWQRKLRTISVPADLTGEGFVELKPTAPYRVSLRVEKGKWIQIESDTADSIAAVVKAMSNQDA